MDYKWEPIKDLPDNWSEMVNQDLPSLASAWSERIRQLKESSELKIFNERLVRQWAIETGIIERLYTLDRGITHLLIEHGIDTSLIPHGATNKPPALVVSIIQDQKEVVEGLFDFVVQRRQLSTSYIKQMHQVFTRNQITTEGVDEFGNILKIEIIRGDWKKWPNNPQRSNGEIHEYCPPEQTASEMDRLITMHQAHIGQRVLPEVEAAWLHHRFTQIHPFQDGNGRVARALASLVFLKEKWFPLVVTNDIRADYIEALEQADHGDLSHLVQLFSKIEINAFRKSLSISDEIAISSPSIDMVINQSLERIQEKRAIRQSRLFDLTRNLEVLAINKLSEIAYDLDSKLREIDNNFWSSVTRSETKISDHWFRSQIIEIANQINYYANLYIYRSWVQLKIKEERITNIIFSFHGLGAGSRFLGIMAVSAFLEFRSSSDEEDKGYEGPYPITSDIFQYSTRDNDQIIEKRFTDWLSVTLMIGLEEWRRHL